MTDSRRAEIRRAITDAFLTDEPAETGGIRGLLGHVGVDTTGRCIIVAGRCVDPSPGCSCGLTSELLAVDPAGGHMHAAPTGQDDQADTVRTADDDRPDMGGLVSFPPAADDTGDDPISADTVRTVPEDTGADSPDTGPSGFRFAYSATVPRQLAGAAFAEAFGLLHKEMDANQAGPGDEHAELVQSDQDDQVSASEEVDEERRRLIHLVHGCVPLHEHLAAADAAQRTIEDLRQRNADLTATLGDILGRFTAGDQAFRTVHVTPKVVERWRRVLAGESRAEAERMPKVVGICPACRRPSLFLGSGGFVTCAMLSCPKPDAPTAVLEDPVWADGDCGRPDCTTALAGALERASRASNAYERLRANVVTAGKYIALQQQLGRFTRARRTELLDFLARGMKDPGPLTNE
ncbi:hypothetical protein [Streptomyces carpinensis]|uniref:Uncharacterized protein n=1 Tax=Streptomyces carpinensis TaxID=66369 RepID=A0ABV1VVT8_9ACTN|nr:hypothetical protein [Streptomyces carpinensis]